MADAATILARLKALTGPDREVDNLISKYLHIASIRWQEPTGRLNWTPFGEWSLTGSIDAAVALVEKVLPGWSWRVNLEHIEPLKGSSATIYNHANSFDNPWHLHRGATPALAILIALFTYLSNARALATASEEKA